MSDEKQPDNSESKKGKRIKSLTLRFNKEMLPFQHVRIEATSTITKVDDVDEVTEELLSHLEHVCDEVERRIFPSVWNKKKDDLPY
jgi:hypothetical protein